MDKVYDFSDRATIEQEAAQWLIRLDSDDELQPAELLALHEWMHRSPAHKAELISFGDFWNNQSLVALPISLESLYYSPAPDGKKRQRKALLWRCAAVMVATVLFAVVLLPLSPIQQFPGQAVAWLTGSTYSQKNGLYAAAVGQHRRITLPDGSVVELNTNSQIQVDYSRDYRSIILLRGEAYFDVAKHKDRPFNVYAGRGRVQAIGTVFTVYLNEANDVDVAVSEGKVALSVLTISAQTNNAPITLSNEEPVDAASLQTEDYYVAIPVQELGTIEAGQATSILVAESHNNKQQPTLSDVQALPEQELARRSAWRSGLLIFTGNSLEEVVKEVSRYTTLSIEIVDPELKKIRIGGRFSIESTRELFDALEANFGLQITRLDYQRVQIASAVDKKSANPK